MLTKIVLLCIVTTMFALEFLTLLQVQGETDLTIHIAYAEEVAGRSGVGLAELGGDGRPHFLFQLLIIAMTRAGLSSTAAAVLLLGVCYGGMAVLIAREMERRGVVLTPLRAFALVPAMLIASHIFVFTLPWRNAYFGYFVPIAYHSGTQQLGKLFALWIYFLYCREFLEDRNPRAATVAAIGALCVVSAVAKPSFLIAFLPAAGCVAALDAWRGRWRAAILWGAAVMVPSALILLWQAGVAYKSGTASAVAFAPFVLFPLATTTYKLPASFAFPLAVWLAGWRDRVVDSRLVFLGLFTTFAMLITLCMVESDRLKLGNFAWTGQTAVFLAYVESMLFLLQRGDRLRWRNVAWVLFGLHVLCGVFWYGLVYSPEWITWW